MFFPHQLLVRVEFHRADVHEMAHFDIGAALFDVFEPLADGGKEACTLEYDVRALTSRRAFANELDTVRRVRHLCNVDDQVGTR